MTGRDPPAGPARHADVQGRRGPAHVRVRVRRQLRRRGRVGDDPRPDRHGAQGGHGEHRATACSAAASRCPPPAPTRVIVEPENAATGSLKLSLPLDVRKRPTLGGPPTPLKLARPGPARHGAVRRARGSARRPVRLGGDVRRPVAVVHDPRPRRARAAVDHVHRRRQHRRDAQAPGSGRYTMFIEPDSGATGSLKLGLPLDVSGAADARRARDADRHQATRPERQLALRRTRGPADERVRAGREARRQRRVRDDHRPRRRRAAQRHRQRRQRRARRRLRHAARHRHLHGVGGSRCGRDRQPEPRAAARRAEALDGRRPRHADRPVARPERPPGLPRPQGPAPDRVRLERRASATTAPG